VVRINIRLGEGVVENDVLAVLESREIADAKAEFLAARRAEELAKSVLDRNEKMWKDKIIPEKDLIASRNAHQHTLIKFDLAHQRLHTMGLSEAEIDALPASADETTFRFNEIRSPIAGRVTARKVLLGQAVTTDKDNFTVAELSTVWIELAVAPSDLAFAKEGQEVRVYSGSREASAKVMALSPVIDPDTRSAKAIAELDNTAGDWKLGDFVSARLMAGERFNDRRRYLRADRRCRRAGRRACPDPCWRPSSWDFQPHRLRNLESACRLLPERQHTFAAHSDPTSSQLWLACWSLRSRLYPRPRSVSAVRVTSPSLSAAAARAGYVRGPGHGDGADTVYTSLMQVLPSSSTVTTSGPFFSSATSTATGAGHIAHNRRRQLTATPDAISDRLIS
jgi:HlyD family secretion protein